jgi:hypothetical protein
VPIKWSQREATPLFSLKGRLAFTDLSAVQDFGRRELWRKQAVTFPPKTATP